MYTQSYVVLKYIQKFERIMKKTTYTICFLLCMTSVVGFATPASAQNIFPAVNIECDVEIIEILDYTYTTHNTFCTIENPTIYAEEVKLDALGNGTAINGVPESISLAAGESKNIDIEIDVSGIVTIGIVNISLQGEVTQAAGIPANIFGASDSSVIGLDFLEYLEIDLGEVEGEGEYIEGENIIITIPEGETKIITNSDRTIYLRVHLFEENENSNDAFSNLPEDFEFINGETTSGDGVCRYSESPGMDPCSWEITTPGEIEEDWNGCAVVYAITTWDDVEANFDLSEMPTSCNSNVYGSETLDISIEKKNSVNNLLSIGGNDSFIGQLGITEDQLPLIGGSVLILLTMIIVLVFIRRRR